MGGKTAYLLLKNVQEHFSVEDITHIATGEKLNLLVYNFPYSGKIVSGILKISSDNKNKELAKKIEELLGKTCVSIVCISPERYNSLYDEIGRNLNKVLGWGHARVMENLLSDNVCENAIADQFGDESIIKSALLAKGKSLNLIQSPKAERDIGVAAASILARARFLNELERLGKILGVTLSKGVNSTVESIAKNIYENGGLEKLKQFVKLHFQTTKKIIK